MLKENYKTASFDGSIISGERRKVPSGSKYLSTSEHYTNPSLESMALSPLTPSESRVFWIF